MRGKYKVTLRVILVLLSILIISSGCSPETEPAPAPDGTPTPTPAPAPTPIIEEYNRAPVISLVTAQTQVHPSTIVELILTATDPDGDAISYEWSTTGGAFSGAVPTQSWVAPEQYGDYDITVTAKDGKGGITQTSITLSVVENLYPAITSLTADTATLLPGDRTLITCVATDPDGDNLNYKWEIEAGEITGVGDKVTWIAPDIEGEYTITALVDDGKGGGDMKSTSVSVTKTEMTQTFTPIAKETGTVSSEGDKDNSRTWAGDDDDNIGYRAFWSFDLYEVRGTEVKEAKLVFTTKFMERDPFLIKQGEGLKGLYLWQIEDDSGQLPDYTIEPEKILKVSGDDEIWDSPPESVDITDIVKRIGTGLSPRDKFQLMARFVVDTSNGTSYAEWLEWQKVVMVVSYAKK
jgi:hypothetical protein